MMRAKWTKRAICSFLSGWQRRRVLPRFICKIPHEGKDYYLIYSTVIDSFVTYGASLEEFTEFMTQQEGLRYMQSEHPRRMERVEVTGTSEIGPDGIEDMILCNRCGPKEENLTLDQIIETFIINRPEGEVEA
jgi:hypothetical protein